MSENVLRRLLDIENKDFDDLSEKRGGTHN